MGNIDFDAPDSRRTYSDREVSAEWRQWWTHVLAPAGKTLVDLGCGGGIYCRGFVALGAKRVLGIDGSRQYLREALTARSSMAPSHFVHGRVEAIPLVSGSADAVFSRAVIHHLDRASQYAQAREARRVLRPGGMFAVQDRTMEDVDARDERYWIRATLFEAFPELAAWERQRRPNASSYVELLRDAGFEGIELDTLPEVRTYHRSFEALADEIRARKGKSILFELNDRELDTYVEALARAWAEREGAGAIVEIDPWTVWRGIR